MMSALTVRAEHATGLFAAAIVLMFALGVMALKYWMAWP